LAMLRQFLGGKSQRNLHHELTVVSYLVVSTPLKMMEFVSWDDYSQYMEK